MKKNIRQGQHKGMTLVEVLITVAVLGLVIVSLLQAFVYFSVLSNMAGTLSAAGAKAQSKIEEIRGHSFSAIATNFGTGGTPGNIFLLTRANDGVDGAGVIYIDAVNASLLKVTVVISFKNKEGRIIGADNGGTNPVNALNGILDVATGEVPDANGRLSSPMLTFVSYVAQR